MLPILLALTASADEPTSDIVVARIVDASPAEVAPHFEDTTVIEKMMPERCGYGWIHGDHPYGPAEMQYNIKSFQRRLQVQLTVRKPLRRIEMDHLGPKGFITDYLFESVDGRTKVTIHTYLNAPGWPVKKYYYETVKPKWERCHGQMLDNLEKRLKAK